MNYFTLQEFLHSDTALKNKIPNLPSFEVVENIKLLVPMLNEIRHSWGSAITISSGFRCPELNVKVGGSPTSAHLKGLAVDLVPSNGKIQEFIEFCKRYFSNTKFEFDQCILEKVGSSQWVHVSIDPKNRKQIFSINKE